MKIFYKPKTKHLIVVPARNGTSHLYNNMREYGLVDTTYKPFFDSIIHEAEKKTFIYRDPCLRLLSFYNQFIYEPYINKIKTSSVKSKDDAGYVDFAEKFVSIVRGDDLFSDLVFSRKKIEKNYTTDVHTCPQYVFFEKQTDEKINDYEIISVNQYVKWIKLTFADMIVESRPSPIEKIPITPGRFINMHIIQNMCNDLYKNDYKFLEPTLTFI